MEETKIETTKTEINKTFGKGAAYVLVILVIISGLGGVILLKNHYTKEKSANIILQTYAQIPTQAGKVSFYKQSNGLKTAVDPELVDLNSQIITCQPGVDSLLSANPSVGGSCIASGESKLQNINGMYLGGQCCGTLMDTKKYHENLQKLQAYKDLPDIILDPMHTPIALAKTWIDYNKNIKLTPAQQKIYDEALTLSEEGPCCCKCWHYYVNEGIAKKMIIVYNYTPKQIADYWDASDICGK